MADGHTATIDSISVYDTPDGLKPATVFSRVWALFQGLFARRKLDRILAALDPGRPRCFLVHGFNVSDYGAATIAKMGFQVMQAGYQPVVVPYGWRGLLGVRLFNHDTAKMIANSSTQGDIAIGHSNGCAILHDATYCNGCELGAVAYIQPALDRDLKPSPVAAKWAVVYNAGDDVVGLAKWLPWHVWGAMGRDGATHDERVKQIDTGPDCVGHSTFFQDRFLARYGPRLMELIT